MEFRNSGAGCFEYRTDCYMRELQAQSIGCQAAARLQGCLERDLPPDSEALHDCNHAGSKITFLFRGSRRI